METQKIQVAVCSRSFSNNETLRKELLAQFPHAKFNDDGLSLKGESLIKFLQGSQAAIIGLEPINQEILTQLPELKIIGKYGVGVNNINFEALKKNNIRFGWVKGVNKKSVAELSIGFMIGLLRNFPSHWQDLKAHEWKPLMGKELGDCTVGIIGCGHVGKEVAKLLKAFGATVLINDLMDMPDFCQSLQISQVDKETLLKNSNIVTLHTPLDDSTLNFITKKELKQMKSGSYLINTARGGLVDENDLFEALETKHLAGAAFDVFEDEPAQENKLHQLKQFLATPHIAGTTETSVLLMGRSAIQGLTNAKEVNQYTVFN